jgi:hypothetical protein
MVQVEHLGVMKAVQQARRPEMELVWAWLIGRWCKHDNAVHPAGAEATIPQRPRFEL